MAATTACHANDWGSRLGGGVIEFCDRILLFSVLIHSWAECFDAGSFSASVDKDVKKRAKYWDLQ